VPHPSSPASQHAAEISRILTILHKWGIHTLGQLAALAPDELGARLGPTAVTLWEQANGRATRLLRLVRPAEVFAEEIEFEQEIETTEPLLFVLRRFLEQLALRLGALYLVAREIRLRFTFSDKSRYEHCFQIPDPTSSVEILFRLLQAHLEPTDEGNEDAKSGQCRRDLPGFRTSLARHGKAGNPYRQQDKEIDQRVSLDVSFHARFSV